MESLIDDPALLNEIASLSTTASDPTGNWIGGGRPRTNVGAAVVGDITAQAFARWSAIHYSFYAALIAMDPVKFKTELSVIDLGCAGGARAKQLAAHYKEVLALDRDARCIDFAKANNGGFNVCYERCDWPRSIYLHNRIFAVEFFEHFAPADQVVALRAAVAALYEGGLLLMTMPNEPPRGPPHQGTLLDDGFDYLLARSDARVRARGHFDNEAPGDPCRDDWSPIGPKPSHHYAVLEV